MGTSLIRVVLIVLKVYLLVRTHGQVPRKVMQT